METSKIQNRINSITQDDAPVLDFMEISENKTKILVHYKIIDMYTIEEVIWEDSTTSLEETPEFNELHKSKSLKEIKALF